MRKIFSTTLALSNHLQQKGLDLAKACLLVESTVQVSKDDKVFQDLYYSAKHFADINVANELCSSASRPKRVKQMPQNLEESIVVLFL